MVEDAGVDLDLIGGDGPRLCRRGHQAGPGLGGDGAIAAPEALRRVRGPRDLKEPTEIRVAVDVAVAPSPVRGVDNPDGFEVGVELLGDEGGKAGVDSLSHLDLAREDDNRAVALDADVRVNRIFSFSSGERPQLGRRSRLERTGRLIAREHRRGIVDGLPYSRIRTASAEVGVHPPADRCVVRLGVRLEQRDGRERLARLAVATLHDVVVEPRVTYYIGDAPGHAFDRRDLLPDRPASGDLARLLVLAIDEDRAGGAETGSATELCSLEAEYVPQDPQQRRRLVAVVDVGLGAVHNELHTREFVRSRST